MPKSPDYDVGNEIIDLIERFLERFPAAFEGFDSGKVRAIITKRKRGRMKLHAETYPRSVFSPGFVYIFEAAEKTWKDMSDVQKRLEVFHVMCAIPRGGFDPTSKDFGRKLKPEIEMYMMEYAASGGVPNWAENPAAKDPLKQKPADLDGVVIDVLPGETPPPRVPLTPEQVASA